MMFRLFNQIFDIFSENSRTLFFQRRQVNKRFARLESHVVTLARSVAHLSSEMRNHNGLYTDVEDIKREMGRLKEMVQARNHQTNPLSDWERFRGWVPSLTNPKRVNKLTK